MMNDAVRCWQREHVGRLHRHVQLLLFSLINNPPPSIKGTVIPQVISDKVEFSVVNFTAPRQEVHLGSDLDMLKEFKVSLVMFTFNEFASTYHDT